MFKPTLLLIILVFIVISFFSLDAWQSQVNITQVKPGTNGAKILVTYNDPTTRQLKTGWAETSGLWVFSQPTLRIDPVIIIKTAELSWLGSNNWTKPQNMDNLYYFAIYRQGLRQTQFTINQSIITIPGSVSTDKIIIDYIVR